MPWLSACSRWLGMTLGRCRAVRARRPARPSWLTLESLEDRCVPAVTIAEFANGIPFNASPWGIAAGPDGNLWFTESGTTQIGRITPSGTVTQYGGLTPSSSPEGITLGPDGNLWFTEFAADQIGMITPTGTVTEYGNGDGITPGAEPLSITAGPGPNANNLWFTEYGSNQIGEITASGLGAGMVTEWSSGITADAGLSDITLGPDGNLWFTENNANQIGMITPGGSVTEFPTGITPPPNSGPLGITAGPDGNLWFTEGDQIGQINPTTHVVTDFSTGITGTNLTSITVGPDGNLWFTEGISNQIGRITTAGVVTEFNVGISPNSDPLGITTGPDGNVWFTEFTGNRIGKVTGVQSATTTALSSSDTAPVVGETIVLTATVATAVSGIPAPTSGVVTFSDGNRVLGAAALSGGLAVFSTDVLSAGTHQLTATFAGNASFTSSTSTPPVTEQVSAASTSTSLVTSGTPTIYGQPVTFTATVSATNSPATPTGTVGFFDGSTLLGTASLSGGVASWTTATLTAGDHPQITATYNATANFNTSNTDATPLDQDVTAAMTGTELITSASVTVYGVPVTLTAIVGATNSPATPLGTVSFYDGTTLLGTASLSGGVASLSTAALTAGDHRNTVTAVYNPTANFQTSNFLFPLDVLVSPAMTSIALQSAAMSTAGQVVTYVATVSDTNSPAVPLGYVTFLDGGNVIGTSTLSGGVAVLTTTPTLAGGHRITAAYTPTANFQAISTLTPFMQQISAGAAARVVFGQQPTYTYSGVAFMPPVTVFVADAWGNPVNSSAPVTIAIGNNPGGAILGGTLTRPAVNGVATFTNLSLNSRGSGYTLTATSTGLTRATSTAFVVSPATHFSVTAPTSVQSGATFSITVTALDSSGIVNPLYLGTVKIMSSDPLAMTLLASYTFTAADAGKHTFTFTMPATLQTVGKQTLTATDILKATIVGSRVITVTAA